MFSSYTVIEQADADHTDLFIPVLEIEPKSPIAGQQVTITTVLTNIGSIDMSNVQISYGIDGVWVIEDVQVEAPAQKSVKLSFVTAMPVSPGQHQLKACPERQSLGDNGHHCQVLDFVAIDESTIVVTIISPTDGSVLRGEATIKVAALGHNAKKVELYAENELVGTKQGVPFDFTLDTTKYENGKVSVYAIAYDESGKARISSVKKYLIDNGGGTVVLRLIPGEMQEAKAGVGKSVVIESDVTNEQTFKIAATFIVLVKDRNGYTEFLSWEEGKIAAGETLSLSQSWIPEVRGNYSVEAFLWDTVESATPLSDVMLANIVVS